MKNKIERLAYEIMKFENIAERYEKTGYEFPEELKIEFETIQQKLTEIIEDKEEYR